ncbi:MULTISPECIES: efflux RND transporter periplasmic adaptor subunit [Corallococcus]|uniref:efflux RND transporter periplasmic adaptor subunit n=1 Tax=Corallococcus TaxID=83461 RepID=UPI0013772AC0|nr:MULTISPECIES: HlyD family efflux transporter periplasmic adaptor subunit [Corallococcus]NBD08223.1 HlyD family efflux transporter periplasmic adaptor subunit [Corallococcus silvisoli]
MNRHVRLAAVAGVVVSCLACRDPKPAPAPPAASVSAHVAEASLATVTLQPQAEARLALRVQPVEKRKAPRRQVLGGEVVVPSGNALVVTAPVAGGVAAEGATPALRPGAPVKRGDVLLRLVPLATVDRDLLAQARRAVDAAAARDEVAAGRLARTERLLRDGAGTERAVEEARAERAVARSELEAARTRMELVSRSPLESDVSLRIRAPRDGVLRQVSVAPGQSVTAGAPLFEVVGVTANWVRVPLFVDEAPRVKPDVPARVHALLSGRDDGVEALPVMGPPSADPVSATVDRFYELPAAARFAPGQRVAVSLHLEEDAELLAVPASAVVYDALGGAWVYARQQDHVYARVRVDVVRLEGTDLLLGRGPPEGTPVVAVGAAELFGTEFGAGH